MLPISQQNYTLAEYEKAFLASVDTLQKMDYFYKKANLPSPWPQFEANAKKCLKQVRISPCDDKAAKVNQKMTSTYAEAFYTAIRDQNILTAHGFVERGYINIKNNHELFRIFLELFRDSKIGSIKYLLSQGLNMQESFTQFTTVFDETMFLLIKNKSQRLLEICVHHSVDTAQIHNALLKFRFAVGYNEKKVTRSNINKKVKFIFNKLLDINAIGLNGETLLYNAIRKLRSINKNDPADWGIYSNFVIALLANKANPNISSSPLPDAIILQDVDIIQGLLKAGAKITDEHLALAQKQRGPSAQTIAHLLKPGTN